MRKRHIVTITFAVISEPTPGVFYDPQDFVKVAEDAIKKVLIAYEPEVLLSSHRPE